MATDRQRRRSQGVGLALAGGGPGGAVYEIGALRALEEAIEGFEPGRLDVYVGVSAGAFVAASLVNGITPAQMVRSLVTREPGVHPFTPQTFFTPAYAEWARRGATIPRLVADAMLQFTRAPEDQVLIRSLARLTRALPLGLFDNEPLRRWLAEAFSHPGRTDDFRQLERRLFVIAADLDAGRSVKFGEPGLDHVPISTAVQASTALPGLYPPVTVEGRHCVDGVLLRTVHASVALEQGVKLLLCINPIVPVDLDTGIKRGIIKRGALVRRGLPTIIEQTFRTLIHSRLEVGMRRYDERYPDADVLLFEPARDEYQMFFSDIFTLGSRRHVVELAWLATRRDLRRRAPQLDPLLRRHGMRLRPEVLEDVTTTIWEGVGMDPEGRRRPVTQGLGEALDRLESALGVAG
jgi:predicted acylesterase/phospholipase RssA